MLKLNEYIEILGNIRKPDDDSISIASRGFDTSFLAWFSAPENLNRDKILALALVYNLGHYAEEISASVGNPVLNNLYAEAQSSNAPEADFIRWINRQESREDYPQSTTCIDHHKSKLFKLLKDLNRLKRRGWKRHNVSAPESIAEHSYALCIHSLSFCPENLDCNKMLSTALIHDIQEILTGDYTPFDAITIEEKDLKEYKMSKQIAKELNCPELFELFQEQQKRISPEAKMLKDLDKVDAVLLAQYYDNCKRGMDIMITEFLTYAEKIYIGGYGNDIVKNIYNELRMQERQHG